MDMYLKFLLSRNKKCLHIKIIKDNFQIEWNLLFKFFYPNYMNIFYINPMISIG